MKIIMNENSNVLEFTCKECDKKYLIDYKHIREVPLWKYESCSRECAEMKTKNKFLILKSKKTNLV